MCDPTIFIYHYEMCRETEGITEPIDSGLRIAVAYRRYDG